MHSEGVLHTASSRDYRAFVAEMSIMLQEHQHEGLHVVLNSLSHDSYIPASLTLLCRGGQFIEIGKRGIWREAEVAQARPDVNYDVIAVDHRTAKDPAWMEVVLERGAFHASARPVHAL